MNDEICSKLEFKQFAYSDFEPSAFNLARFVESKTNDKYTVIEIQLVRDALSTIVHVSNSLNDLNQSLREKWKEELKMLKL